MLLRRSQLMALSKPVDRNVTSLANWVDGVKPVVAEESGFLDNRADLAALSVQDSNPLEHFISRYLYRIFVTKVLPSYFLEVNSLLTRIFRNTKLGQRVYPAQQQSTTSARQRSAPLSGC